MNHTGISNRARKTYYRQAKHAEAELLKMDEYIKQHGLYAGKISFGSKPVNLLRAEARLNRLLDDTKLYDGIEEPDRAAAIGRLIEHPNELAKCVKPDTVESAAFEGGNAAKAAEELYAIQTFLDTVPDPREALTRCELPQR